MPFANNRGVRIHYQIEGHGAPLVLQHWSIVSLESWYDFGYVGELQKDFELILLDARGHGRSDKPNESEAYELKRRVDDIVAVLDDLDIPKAHYFGYSMGGWIGFGAGVYAPERFHSLIIGGQHPYAQSLEGLRQLLKVGIDNGLDSILEEIRKFFGTMASERESRWLNADLEALMAAAQDRESLEPLLPKFTSPCLLIIGEKDEVYPLAQRSTRQISNVRLVALPNLDHGQCIERLDLVVPQIRSFAASIGPS